MALLINTLISEHGERRVGSGPQETTFLGERGASRPLMTGLAEDAFGA
jgi:hypothetical protein